MLFAALPLCAQNDISFDPSITEEEFATFSRLVAQGIYATPVDAARARGILGFDIGIAVTALPVDTDAAYWQKSVDNDFSVSDYVAVPKLVASKGFSFFTLSASYSQLPDSDIAVWGGSLDVPILGGGIVTPTIAVRGAYAQLMGVDRFELKTYGAELFISKGFGPVTPYAAIGQARSNALGNTSVPTPVAVILEDEHSSTRITVGAKLSLLLPKITVEATQAEERSYSAKLSFGF